MQTNNNLCASITYGFVFWNEEVYSFFFEIKGRISAAQLRQEHMFMYKWQLRCLNTMVRRPKRRKTHLALLVLYLTKVQCSMPLHYVLFGKKCHLVRWSVHIFKDSSIPLLPQIPHNVYHHAIEPPAVLLLNLACRLLPPFGNWGRVLLWPLHHKFFPS